MRRVRTVVSLALCLVSAANATHCGYKPIVPITGRSSDKYVVQNEGGNLGEFVWKSVNQCSKLCDETRGCQSFAHCPGHENRCWLKDRAINEAEPRRYQGYCTSYSKC